MGGSQDAPPLLPQAHTKSIQNYVHEVNCRQKHNKIVLDRYVAYRTPSDPEDTFIGSWITCSFENFVGLQIDDGRLQLDIHTVETKMVDGLIEYRCCCWINC